MVSLKSLAQAPAQTPPPPTAPALKEPLRPLERIGELLTAISTHRQDPLIAKLVNISISQVLNSRKRMNDLSLFVDAYGKLCAEQNPKCAPPPEWNKAACTDANFAADGPQITSLWGIYFESLVTSDESRATAIKAIAECDPESQSKIAQIKAFEKLLFTYPMVSAAEMRGYLKEISLWQPKKPNAARMYMLHKITQLQPHKRIPYPLASFAADLLLRSLYSVAKVGPLSVDQIDYFVKTVVYSGTLNPGGQPLNEATNIKVAQLKAWGANKAQVLEYVFGSCINYRVTGQFQKCAELIAEAKTFPGLENDETLKLEHITVLLDQGKLPEAKKILGEIGNENIWAGFVRSRIARASGEKDKALTILSDFEKKAQLDAWGPTDNFTERSKINRDLKKYAEAKTALETGRGIFTRHVDGYGLPLAFSDLEKLRVAYLLKDKALFDATNRQIQKGLAAAPFKRAFEPLVKALEAAQAGQKPAAQTALNDAKKLLGANHPEVIDTGRVIETAL